MRLALVDSWRSAALPIRFVSAAHELFPHTILAPKTITTQLMVLMPEDCYQNISLIATGDELLSIR